MALPILLVKLKTCCKNPSGKSEATPHTSQIWHRIWIPNTHLGQGSLQTVMWKQLPRTGSIGRDVISTNLSYEVDPDFRYMPK
ncbi:hypothetical protein AVEN_176299-1 [Araneus ventricosus]|uniref:Uncharacterized protein n=1 Tax=Araneus ventricosus TaxID=182803 RepID=A0A4Y2HRW1_ARAVE|nr:hypothetical protein AVEN_176299-1 [Araneus ventricosus]